MRDKMLRRGAVTLIVTAGCGMSLHPSATNASCSVIAFILRVQTRSESAALDVP